MPGLDTDDPTDGLTLWSTQQPSPMCRAAVNFIGLPTTIAVATDPSAAHARANEELDAVWIVWPRPCS
jgi:tRNA(Arg) A34 adenosine deaminase TadA